MSNILLESLINVLINTGMLSIILCGCGCLYLRHSIISNSRQIRNTGNPRYVTNINHNIYPNMYPNIIINGEIYYPQQQQPQQQSNILNI